MANTLAFGGTAFNNLTLTVSPAPLMATLVTTVLERLRQRDDHTERGDTLIELLIAIVIIALP